MKNNNKIQVLGSGCPTCKKLFELTKQAAQELNINTEVEYITDVQKIIDMGIMSSPVLVINDKPVLTGSTSDLERIKQLITNNSDKSIAENKPTCSCGGKC